MWKQESKGDSHEEKLDTIDLVNLLQITEEEFRQRFKGRPILRAKREGLQRNACVALGNLGDPSAVPALNEALSHSSPLVRGHAAWALGQIGTFDAREALKAIRSNEVDPEVLEEIQAALDDTVGRDPVSVIEHI